MVNQKTKAPAGIAQAVTVHTSIDLGGSGLFAVQAGVPLSEALDAMAVLLETAETAANEAAIACGSDNDTRGTVWAIQHVLSLACGLNSAIHGGLIDAERGKP